MKTEKAANTKKPAAPQSSPLPWQNLTDTDGSAYIVAMSGDNTDAVADVPLKADAALIVRRVNQGPAFDAMAEALEKTLSRLEDIESRGKIVFRSDVLDDIRDVLKMAREVK